MSPAPDTLTLSPSYWSLLMNTYVYEFLLGCCLVVAILVPLD